MKTHKMKLKYDQSQTEEVRNVSSEYEPFLKTFFLALVSASSAAAFIQTRTDCGK